MISEKTMKSLKEWLREDGINFFKETKEKHGEIAAVYLEGGIPHSVHFNEGMQVRNFLRGTKECKDWDCHRLDNDWAKIIEEAIK